MKKLLLSGMLCAMGITTIAQETKKFNDTSFMQPVEVAAIRAGEKAPFAKTNLARKDIEKNNVGQDLPFLLNQTPSVVINSDAGNGVGYTGIRIRGTDASRINVTLNGIPYNDAESQGTYFVDLPDIASSANSIQIQRGVGTSSNGAGSFGGNINLSTNEVNEKFYTELNNSYGSYNTWKNTLKFGSGILGKHFTIDGRLSRISSNGYIDRAASNLKSFYFSTAWVDAKNSLRLNIFSGKEKTYQAWNGVAEALLKTDRTYNISGQEQPGKPYPNETDNYTQTHYQLFYNHQFNQYWKANAAVFLTKGKGYYEEYRADQSLSNYGLPDYIANGDTTSSTDMVRQEWLDNNFYGSIFSLQYKKEKTQFTFGGGWNQYDGKHFGNITHAVVQAAVPQNYKWYGDLPAHKKDLSLYAKFAQQLNEHWQLFADMQVRNVNYTINGFRDNPTLKVKNNYTFFNPKAGITYNNNNWQVYASYARAGKEPNRDDFEAGKTQQPKQEELNDVELGVEKKNKLFSVGANLYYMQYHNQLVLIGNINDVGSYTRTNIASSYRAGIELQGTAVISNFLNLAANLTISKNKISHFTELIDDYDNGGTVTNKYNQTNISFSPAVIAGGSINFIPVKHGEISLLSKYVSRQYMDNTSQQSRSLNPYYVQDVRLTYTLSSIDFLKTTTFILQLNNVFNKKYEANGYTFSYYSGGLTTENYYFPMAPFNCMLGVNIRL
ncbi:TonB-dependent receptor plug domain-containing protein [Ferruginibacter paludis]|uniref:TonB-dependent receptor n=1 Tax=Ferruginibacter paludis TaxID=1310417 RepID=UPI0025B3C3ED|nr:TonB-dependent receptor plug domain-containing protein [Ferruginibacter paludis]MDN3656272.1 TonB-dependent receptor plug domain-containing protein [Ferruginibacter paludis]